MSRTPALAPWLPYDHKTFAQITLVTAAACDTLSRKFDKLGCNSLADRCEWGPWVIHNGLGCPLRAGTIVEVCFQDAFGYTSTAVASVAGGDYSSWNWEHYPELKKIVRYREKKPRGLRMLRDRVAGLDAPKKTVGKREELPA